MPPRRQWLVTALWLTTIFACHAEQIAGTTDPDGIEIVTSDIGNFWRAWDAGGSAGTADAFQREYLDRASPGLKDFIARRSLTAQQLANMARSAPRYFAAVRPTMLRLTTEPTVRSQAEADFRRLKEIYPDAVFPTVTLLVGRFSTGGTVGPSGLLIGTEFYVRDANTPVDEIGAFGRANSHASDSLHIIIAHENVHAQQLRAGVGVTSSSTLLEQAIMEGSADFIGELTSGATINDALRAWAVPREHDIWVKFKLAMSGQDVSQWLYNQERGTTDWPGDLGYFVGYRIAAAYYAKQADKKAAVRQIITSRDAAALLTQSGYDP